MFPSTRRGLLPEPRLMGDLAGDLPAALVVLRVSLVADLAGDLAGDLAAALVGLSVSLVADLAGDLPNDLEPRLTGLRVTSSVAMILR